MNDPYLERQGSAVGYCQGVVTERLDSRGSIHRTLRLPPRVDAKLPIHFTHATFDTLACYFGPDMPT